MRSLLHTPLDPASRMVRIILAEKGLTARLVHTPPWDDSGDLAAHNPASTIPVLIDEAPSGDETSISPGYAITEYLEEVYGAPLLLPATSAGRAEARRLMAWFCEKFEQDVNATTLRVKVDQKQLGRGQDEETAAEKSAEAMCWHLDYLSWLLEKRDWLAGSSFTVADIAGAAHFSSVDYLGIVPWTDFPSVKEWYARVKSRPSFQPLLSDRIEGLPPPPHYANLDY